MPFAIFGRAEETIVCTRSVPYVAGNGGVIEIIFAGEEGSLKTYKQ